MARPILFFENQLQFRNWLELHANQETELLVGFWKVGSQQACMSWSESVDQALCFGWIDGVRKGIDAESYTIRFCRRRSDSIWSAVNIEKFAVLERIGAMTDLGRAAFALRQETKSKIYAYEQAEIAQLTLDETVLFQQRPVAWAYFETCPPSYRKTILHWITQAKKSETRMNRLMKTIEASEAHTRLR
ncbi:YdeI/OmpD-associated family protein [Undibacterium fentianense]|uniref:YdeI/OmpD-associated family protein n=1 Tax=Undibacterium fentianense TaxID=2828728 RepID=A0A941E6R5_9BURK|nr:YdeI/OmpD-associated family protein [Undibacterium fentianense]MBR7800788.1 YdeI/OmpD-associated family protein [Undibacterium fentianense]